MMMMRGKALDVCVDKDSNDWGGDKREGVMKVWEEKRMYLLLSLVVVLLSCK